MKSSSVRTSLRLVTALATGLLALSLHGAAIAAVRAQTSAATGTATVHETGEVTLGAQSRPREEGSYRPAQVTVRPDAPKRVFPEEEDRPWTLLVGKALLPATAALGAFIVIWYVTKVTRTRYRRRA